MSGHVGHWGEELERPAPDVITVDGTQLRKGSRVRLLPRPGGDIFDLALAGRTAVIDKIEQDLEDNVTLAITVDDDPGRDLGADRRPGHRFFFSPDEVEPLGPAPVADPGVAVMRILVAGIGNVFLGDDGFGVALAGRMASRVLPPGVHVEDFGIRGLDLAYALDGYDALVLLDATPRGDAPGTLYVIEAEIDPDHEVAVDAHGMDPVTVLSLARTLGTPPPRTIVIGCEPKVVMTGEEDEIVCDLTEPVRAALDGAERLVESVLEDLIKANDREEDPS